MDDDEAGTFTWLHSVGAELFDLLTQKYGGRIFKSTEDGLNPKTVARVRKTGR
jgi:hypothetical protein